MLPRLHVETHLGTVILKAYQKQIVLLNTRAHVNCGMLDLSNCFISHQFVHPMLVPVYFTCAQLR